MLHWLYTHVLAGSKGGHAHRGVETALRNPPKVAACHSSAHPSLYCSRMLTRPAVGRRLHLRVLAQQVEELRAELVIQGLVAHDGHGVVCGDWQRPQIRALPCGPPLLASCTSMSTSVLMSRPGVNLHPRCVSTAQVIQVDVSMAQTTMGIRVILA